MVTIQFEHDLKDAIRTIPDYPKPGIMFRDITTLLGNARAFRRAVDELVQPWAGMKIDKVAGIEARGFILGGAVAHQVSAGFVPIRKKGKLPYKRVTIGYSLEYGIDEMEMHEDAVSKGERVILVDDLIATGGTAEGAVKLLRQLGAQVLAACFLIHLPHDRVDARFDRRMGVENIGETLTRIVEAHFHHRRVRARQLAAALDLAQRADHRVRILGQLHRARVGKKFAFTRQCKADHDRQQP